MVRRTSRVDKYLSTFYVCRLLVLKIPMLAARETSLAPAERHIGRILESAPSDRSQAQFHHLGLRLLQPVRHPHLAVHRRRGGEVLLRLLTLARAPVELAEAEVAVGDKGSHAARLGCRECGATFAADLPELRRQGRGREEVLRWLRRSTGGR